MKFIPLYLLLISFNVVADTIEKEFEKFFNTSMPTIKDDASITISPKDSNVLPVTDQNALINISISILDLSKLLILHGENKYPDKVCKSINKQTFVAGYNFGSNTNIYKNTISLRVDCSSDVIVWAKTKNGKFYKTKKSMRVFHFHRNNNQ